MQLLRGVRCRWVVFLRDRRTILLRALGTGFLRARRLTHGPIRFGFTFGFVNFGGVLLFAVRWLAWSTIKKIQDGMVEKRLMKWMINEFVLKSWNGRFDGHAFNDDQFNCDMFHDLSKWLRLVLTLVFWQLSTYDFKLLTTHSRQTSDVAENKTTAIAWLRIGLKFWLLKLNWNK